MVSKADIVLAHKKLTVKVTFHSVTVNHQS